MLLRRKHHKIRSYLQSHYHSRNVGITEKVSAVKRRSFEGLPREDTRPQISLVYFLLSRNIAIFFRRFLLDKSDRACLRAAKDPSNFETCIARTKFRRTDDAQKISSILTVSLAFLYYHAEFACVIRGSKYFLHSFRLIRPQNVLDIFNILSLAFARKTEDDTLLRGLRVAPKGRCTLVGSFENITLILVFLLGLLFLLLLLLRIGNIILALSRQDVANPELSRARSSSLLRDLYRGS